MLQWMNFEDVMPMEVLVAQFCPTLWDPMDARPRPLPVSSVHGIIETGILELVVILFSRGDPGSPAL